MMIYTGSSSSSSIMMVIPPAVQMDAQVTRTTRFGRSTSLAGVMHTRWVSDHDSISGPSGSGWRPAIGTRALYSHNCIQVLQAWLVLPVSFLIMSLASRC